MNLYNDSKQEVPFKSPIARQVLDSSIKRFVRHSSMCSCGCHDWNFIPASGCLWSNRCKWMMELIPGWHTSKVTTSATLTVRVFRSSKLVLFQLVMNWFQLVINWFQLVTKFQEPWAHRCVVMPCVQHRTYASDAVVQQCTQMSSRLRRFWPRQSGTYKFNRHIKV